MSLVQTETDGQAPIGKQAFSAHTHTAHMRLILPHTWS